MKRYVVTALFLLLAIAAPATLEAREHKLTSIDMRTMNHIFVGWVDLHPEAFVFLGYSKKSEWTETIDGLNAYFLQVLKSEDFPARTINGATKKEDENATGNDLYIKFTDVSVDREYRLHLTIHLIDPKTNTELGVIPNDTYTGRVCGLEGCLQKSLTKIGKRLVTELSSAPEIKK